uniref:Na+/H+ antiporter NhaD n=1 Tax=uncultured bacterium UPO46 TaxID=1776971 RepID=A0A126SY66_9BACT|nr:Na+/H+ antiporter NhaD [uncultured bacterium UPO46]
MRRRRALLLAACASACASIALPPAHAATDDDSADRVPRQVVDPVPLKPLPGRLGYAFNKPDILLRQRLFGLAHGVSLLAAGCLDLSEHTVAVQHAYADWHARHAQALEAIVGDLATHYFGAQAGAAQWPDLVQALGLKQDIRLALGGFELSVACATLVAAIAKPRYDLTTLLREEPATALATIDGLPPPATASEKTAAPATAVAPQTTPAPTTESAGPTAPTPSPSSPPYAPSYAPFSHR